MPSGRHAVLGEMVPVLTHFQAKVGMLLSTPKHADMQDPLDSFLQCRYGVWRPAHGCTGHGPLNVEQQHCTRTAPVQPAQRRQ